MPTFKVHVVFTVPAAEEQDAETQVYELLEDADFVAGAELDWDIVEVWDFDEDEDEEKLTEF